MARALNHPNIFPYSNKEYFCKGKECNDIYEAIRKMHIGCLNNFQEEMKTLDLIEVLNYCHTNDKQNIEKIQEWLFVDVYEMLCCKFIEGDNIKSLKSFYYYGRPITKKMMITAILLNKICMVYYFHNKCDHDYNYEYVKLAIEKGFLNIASLLNKLRH